MKITDDMVERAAMALVVATAKTYGDPLPKNPDLTFTRILARAALEAALRHSESE